MILEIATFTHPQSPSHVTNSNLKRRRGEGGAVGSRRSSDWIWVKLGCKLHVLGLSCRNAHPQKSYFGNYLLARDCREVLLLGLGLVLGTAVGGSGRGNSSTSLFGVNLGVWRLRCWLLHLLCALGELSTLPEKTHLEKARTSIPVIPSGSPNLPQPPESKARRGAAARTSPQPHSASQPRQSPAVAAAAGWRWGSGGGVGAAQGALVVSSQV